MQTMLESPGIWIVVFLIAVAGLLAAFDLWTNREAVKSAVKSAWGGGWRWLTVVLALDSGYEFLAMKPGTSYWWGGALGLMSVLWLLVALYEWRSVLLVKVNQGHTLPRFYGIAWSDWCSPTYTCAPAPFNVLLGWAHSFWWFLRAGWRPVYANPREAYYQGRKEALAELRKQAKEPGWFERFAAGEYDLR
jgi:hypothetical protein